MIDDSLLNKEHFSILKAKGVGQILVKFRDGTYMAVRAACPKCQLQSRTSLVIGWMYLHKQPNEN